jgi:hypothetical protein
MDKYRIWDKHEKRWIARSVTIWDLVTIFQNNPVFTEPAETLKKRLVFQRSTGLVDLKRREIFEGDIIENMRGQMCVIVYESSIDQAGFVAEEISKNDAKTKQWYWMGLIVGNIFENEELLKL